MSRAILCLAVLQAACASNRSSDDDLKKAKSWAATVRLTGETYLSGAIPPRYAVTVLESAREELNREADKSGARIFTERTRSIADSAGRLAKAVREGDRAAAGEVLRALDAGERAIGDRVRKLPR